MAEEPRWIGLLGEERAAYLRGNVKVLDSARRNLHGTPYENINPEVELLAEILISLRRIETLLRERLP
jgi:hypothetical protein